MQTGSIRAKSLSISTFFMLKTIKTISKVAIIKTKTVAVAFSLFPPFFLLPLLFLLFFCFISAILELIGPFDAFSPK